MFISVLTALICVCAVIAGQRVYQCDNKNANDNYMQCLNKWRVFRSCSLGHAQFLKDVTLIDEICILDRSKGVLTVEEMDTRVTNAIPLYCNFITAHWKGLKQFVIYLCEHREEFQGIYAQCRTNRNFQSAYHDCKATHVKQIIFEGDSCSSYREMEKCFKNALANHCSKNAAEFFMEAFSKRDDPLIAISCKKEKEEKEKQSTDNRPMTRERVVLAEESLAVNEESGSDILCARCYLIISIYMWRLAISFLAVYLLSS
ncbi:uncharacterized protein LOC132717034 [Ruditapes philippinarum]|uniref:uncharacterized protein LOC132717034 n=1 Tax=Ruditapes philippinarum TaxID=129788 RepID=UPI00295AB62A|nr:uncharacterized protein LOC132717034 [Ruditapes philippinarum]